MKKDEYNSNFSQFSFNDAISCRGECDLYFKQICGNNDSKVIISLIKYLSFSELINLKLTCKPLNKKINKKILKKFVRLGNISDSFRPRYWKSTINHQKIEDSIRREIKDIQIQNNLYQYLVSQAEYLKSNPPNDKIKIIYDEISRDLNRTFHTDKFNSIEGQNELGRILCAVAYVRPEIGYCQGMNFVVGALLTILKDEELAFWSFIVLLDEYELSSLYLRNMPDYSIRIYQIKFYMKIYFPEVFYHLKNQQIHDIFISKWILTVFSSYLPFETLSVVWDIFLQDHWKAIIKFSLIFILELKETILKTDLNSLSKFFRDNNRTLHQNPRKVLSMYHHFIITNKQLEELREQYFIELAKRKLEDGSSVWENDQLDPLNLYRKEKEKLETIVKKEISVYQKQVQEIDKIYQASKKTYSCQLKQCNSIKNKIEELIDSKSAYDNVYLMLKNEQHSINLKKKYPESNRKPSPKKENSTHKQSMPLYNSFNTTKKISIEEEIRLIEKKIGIVKVQIESLNGNLKESVRICLIIVKYRILDEKKQVVESMKKEKVKFKNGLEGYLKMYEIKENELLRLLAEKLKLSEKFVKSFQF